MDWLEKAMAILTTEQSKNSKNSVVYLQMAWTTGSGPYRRLSWPRQHFQNSWRVQKVERNF